jgi:hypothetical protein
MSIISTFPDSQVIEASIFPHLFKINDILFTEKYGKINLIISTLAPISYKCIIVIKTKFCLLLLIVQQNNQ